MPSIRGQNCLYFRWKWTFQSKLRPIEYVLRLESSPVRLIVQNNTNTAPGLIDSTEARYILGEVMATLLDILSFCIVYMYSVYMYTGILVTQSLQNLLVLTLAHHF